MNALNIKHYLADFATGEVVYYCPNPGNAGDSLIAQATLQLFHDAGIKYKLVPWKRLDRYELAGRVLMFGGGGNLVGYYKQARMVISRYHRDVKKLVILPHTIKGNEDLLGELGENVDIIVREPVSYEHVKKHNAKSRVMLMDDLALSLDVHKVFAWKPGSLARYALKKWLTGNVRKSEATVPSPSRIISNNLFEFRRVMDRAFKRSGHRVLNCFRTGLEATDIALPADNVDLSKVYAYGVHNEELIRYASRRLLKFMNRYHEIRTNRLHLCVAGALLGKRVRFYPNSYWKCEAIFNHSIKDRFENVEWCGDLRG